MSNLNEEEIAEYLAGMNSVVTVEKDIGDLLIEWEDLIDELSEKEIALYQWKHVYNVKAEGIIQNVDFKKVYGANNRCPWR